MPVIEFGSHGSTHRLTAGGRSLAATLLGLMFAATPVAALEARFDTDLEGWSVNGDNDSRWQAGTLYVDDLAVGDINYVIAPAPWLGDWSDVTNADSLAADYYFVNTSGGALLSPAGLFELKGPGGHARALPGLVPVQGQWKHYAVSMNPADWTMVSGTWSALLEEVQTLVLAGEFVNGEENVFVDNIRLTHPPAPLAFPCVVERFDASLLLDMRFDNTGGTSLQATGGNLARFCQITDATGTSQAYLPPRFLGDWRPLEGNSTIGLDVRILSYTGTPAGQAEFIRISGPGGTAHVSLATADLPPSARVWKRYSYPISAAAWTVTSGTWAGLLANVTECRVTVEFVSGTEVVGIDNLFRDSAACGDPDNAVTARAPDVQLCGYDSFVGIAGVARQPVSGDLFGLVDLDASSGGGLYRALGSTAGVRLQSYASPNDLLADAAGNFYVSESISGNVYRWVPAVGSSLWVSGFHANDDDPFGMCTAPAGFSGPNVAPGDILVTDRGVNGPDEVWAFSPNAAENERLVLPDPGETDYLDMAGGSSGIVYMVDALDANRISRLAPNGTLSYLALSTPVPAPTGIAWDGVDDQLYVVSGTGHSLHRVDPLTGVVTLIADGFAGPAPCAVEIDPTSRRLWLADKTGGRIYTFCLLDPSGVGDEPHRPTPVAARILGAPTVTPNPSAGPAAIDFTLTEPATVELAIFDVTGRRVTRLAAAPFGAGAHRIAWDGRDESGREVVDGLYFVRAATGTERVTGRLTRIR